MKPWSSMVTVSGNKSARARIKKTCQVGNGIRNLVFGAVYCHLMPPVFGEQNEKRNPKCRAFPPCSRTKSLEGDWDQQTHICHISVYLIASRLVLVIASCIIHTYDITHTFEPHHGKHAHAHILLIGLQFIQ